MGSSSAPDRCEGLNAVAELGSDLKSLLKLLRRTSSELQAGHDEAEEHGFRAGCNAPRRRSRQPWEHKQ